MADLNNLLSLLNWAISGVLITPPQVTFTAADLQTGLDLASTPLANDRMSAAPTTVDPGVAYWSGGRRKRRIDT